jgi:hypothetical protein
MADAEAPKRRTFRKFTYRGVDLEQVLMPVYREEPPLPILPPPCRVAGHGSPSLLCLLRSC